MYYIDTQGRKVVKKHPDVQETYTPPVRTRSSKEYFGPQNSKCPKWLFWVLVVVGVLLLLALATMLFKSIKGDGSSKSPAAIRMSSMNYGGKKSSFGFKFY